MRNKRTGNRRTTGKLWTDQRTVKREDKDLLEGISKLTYYVRAHLKCVIYEKASRYLTVPPECLSYNGKSEESTQKILQKIMTMEAEYPLECRKARQESWNKLVSFFGEW